MYVFEPYHCFFFSVLRMNFFNHELCHEWKHIERQCVTYFFTARGKINRGVKCSACSHKCAISGNGISRGRRSGGAEERRGRVSGRANKSVSLRTRHPTHVLMTSTLHWNNFFFVNTVLCVRSHLFTPKSETQTNKLLLRRTHRQSGTNRKDGPQLQIRKSNVTILRA